MRFCSQCGDPIEANEKYCNKCGHRLMPENKKIPLIPKKIIIGGISIIIIALILSFFLVTILNQNSLYIDTNNYKNDSELSSQNNSKKNHTAIIYDNVYSGVALETEEDAKNLIIEDSISQKSSCPKEIEAIEEEWIQNYNITAVNLCELDVSFAQELTNVLEIIYQEYPSISDILTNITLVNGNLENNYIAAFMPVFNFAYSDQEDGFPWVIKTQILLNTTYFFNLERLSSAINQSVNTGHFPPNATIYSPVAHEFGHYLSFLAMMKNYNMSSILLIENNETNLLYKIIKDFNDGSFSLEMIEEAYNNYQQSTTSPLPFDEWRGTISDYALAKDNYGKYIYDETIAEAFHDVYLNKDAAAEASKYIVEVLQEKLES